mgnify:CR=1 FL=1
MPCVRTVQPQDLFRALVKTSHLATVTLWEQLLGVTFMFAVGLVVAQDLKLTPRVSVTKLIPNYESTTK